MGARINGPLNWFNKANKTKAGNIYLVSYFRMPVCWNASATKNLDRLLLLFQPIKKQCWIFSRSAILGLVEIVVDGQDFLLHIHSGRLSYKSVIFQKLDVFSLITTYIAYLVNCCIFTQDKKCLFFYSLRVTLATI